MSPRSPASHSCRNPDSILPMKIYTRTGDTGTTALFGGNRVPKTHPRIVAYGTVDELNSIIGLARAHLTAVENGAQFDRILAKIQIDLFTLGADLATPADSRAKVPRTTRDHARRLEEFIDQLEEDLETLRRFILPGGCLVGATLHVARTVCRRAERRVFHALGEEQGTDSAPAVYLNRLSDLLFVAARWINTASGIEEDVWEPPSDGLS